jgi:tetratricopeptide (TPR) repeat protein
MATAELSIASVEELARTDLKEACNRARELVAAEPFDEGAAKLLREVVERYAREAPPQPDPTDDLPPPLQEASRLLSADQLSTEQDEAAEIIVRGYLTEHPNDVRAMAMMAEIASRCDFFDDAEKILKRALEIDPRSVDALLMLVKLINHLSFVEHRDRGDEALKIVKQALEIDPQNVNGVSLYSSILVRFRRVKEAVPWYDRLLDLNPLHSLAWANYGSLLNSLGNFGKSIAALRTATAINPLYGLPWWEIANLKISKLFASDVERMEEVLDDPLLDPKSRSHIHFALAKAADQSKRFEAAMGHLRIGNEIKCELEPHDPDKVTSDVENSERTFTPQFFESRRRFGNSRPDPIFIVGMQRAGTTLVEQILSSHSQIEGTEELFYILQLGTEISARNPGVPWQIGLERATPEALNDLGAAFLRLSRHFRLTKRPFFIDKNPANWRFTGLIATALPNAKIVDVRRSPMDCCFANYTQHYENGVGFSYSQVGLARYYSDYVRLMRHFDRIAPGKVHRVIYEDLVDDLEGSVRGLLDYLELPFEESCLRFFETDRPVLTPSSQQVRQPINRSGIGRWRNYEHWLGQLQQGLGDVLGDWRT